MFGEAEQEYGGVEFGMIGASESGRLRTVAKDTQKLAKRNALDVVSNLFKVIGTLASFLNRCINWGPTLR